MKAKVIIGLVFGDEGKGITTSSVTPSTNSIVVRFSGGQQAGHNVMYDKLQHVHSSFCSGTLQGIPSYFSHYCTIHPSFIRNEYNILIKKGITPKLYIHPLALVTTPYDVLFNRTSVIDEANGTCGMGVGATMNRNLNSGYKLFAIDLLNPVILRQKMKNIEEYYSSKINRNEELYEALDYFYETVENNKYFSIADYSFLYRFRNITFEGSQGILLDMDHGIFPNVTYSNTTSKNALEICKLLEIEDISIYYVTRCYQTRHGKGWMSNNDKISLINTENEINVHNMFQQDFRIGELDYDLLNYSLDIDDIYSSKITNKSIIVTCLDQRPGFKFDHTKLNYGSVYFNYHYTYSPKTTQF